ncbi:putative ribosomal N-acetyltransferase YdaF [Daldinia childiae]|uniref:putative ribosomal N-acetyltransferase YdaF n=1 Tax=Daldinia childiae TaxID=326645 RepID=UPI0014465EAA|nr:putative ribosomal N-acetyltransferase YdaF [Daldinia childiae]KAF3059214.1 putative ribosomal N-acetyltransferase YdaF [Daldinia childiae]
MPEARPLDPFRSERLVYRAVNDQPQDIAFIHSIQRDAEAQSGSSYALLRPESIKASTEFKDRIEKCLLGALICLPVTGLAEKDSETLPIGIICLKATPLSHAHHRNSDISIDIAKEYRGQGYGGEAIRWALWYGFQMAGLHRISIETFSFNEGAMKLYERLGFTCEGKHREAMWFNGRWHDDVVYGMLEDEWREEQRKAGNDV